MLDFIKEKLKNDTILVVSGVLAIISCFIIHPDKQYIDYINFKVLAILFALMLVVNALVRIGTFDYVTGRLLMKIHSEKNMSLFFVTLAYFMSMLLTNDVTLVTLVPLAIMVLSAFHDRRRLMYTLIIMTAAANLGSMLTPIGNPQNLYLFTEYKFKLGDFLIMMLPYSTASLILVALCVFVLNRTDKTVDEAVVNVPPTPQPIKLIIYSVLFIVCILTVSNLLDYRIMLAIVAAVMIIADRKAFAGVDYTLLLTFVFFFVLIGNLGRVEAIHDVLSSIVDKNTVFTAVLSSQIISNVPAAMLLSAFTANGRALTIGVNLGGLGTLIASMASLITYKFYAKLERDECSSNNRVEKTQSRPTRRAARVSQSDKNHCAGVSKENGKGLSYLAAFTVINVILLIILYVMYLIVG